jgi:hypothetical protein
MDWLSIKSGRTTPQGWNAVRPRLFHAGFKGSVFFPSACTKHHGRHRLFGKKFISGDSIAITWSPCLEVGNIALYLEVVSGGMDYSYSLVSVAANRPVTVELEVRPDNRIVAAVDSFEGVFRLVTTHDSFQHSLIGFDLIPKLQTPAIQDIKNFLITSPIKRVRLPL